MAVRTTPLMNPQRYSMIDHPTARGGFANIYRVRDRETQSEVALKCIEFDVRKDGIPSDVLREISILKDMDHENVVRLLSADATLSGFNLFFEWMGYDLNRMIKTGNCPPRLIKDMLFQILQGVAYCHSQKVLHRDLKPPNLLVNFKTKTLKLADFGFSRTFEVAALKYSTEVTTIAYRAPELLLRRNPYTAAVDMWSVGCIFAEMVTKRVLFSGTSDTIVMRKIIRMLGVPKEFEVPGMESDVLKVCKIEMLPSDPIPKLADVFPGLQAEGLDLLQKMLCMIPGRRISAHAALLHPYFNK